jgi:hypothetical integral membrane protein (TIGR02206 family)
MIIFRNKIQPYKKIIKWTLFTILLSCLIAFQLYLVLMDQWKANYLPLQLCSFSTYLALFLFLKPNKKVFNVLFFIGLLPPILSMLTPDMAYKFPHFRYIRYYLQHSAIPLAVLYFILFEGYRVPRKAIFYTFISINLLAVPMYILNLILGTNFFFLMSPALESKTLLSFFGTGIMYYINIEIVAIISLFITYIPMGIIQKVESKNMRKGEGVG